MVAIPLVIPADLALTRWTPHRLVLRLPVRIMSELSASRAQTLLILARLRPGGFALHRGVRLVARWSHHRDRVALGAAHGDIVMSWAELLVRAAEERWRRINAPHLVPLVRAGAIFIDGQLQERKEAATERTEDPITEEDVAA